MYLQLTEFTDNALRLLIYLGGHRERIATIAEIAERYGISRHHLAKVSCVLAASNLIETSRGRLGGMRLRAAPGDIRLGEVVRCTERGLVQPRRSQAANQASSQAASQAAGARTAPSAQEGRLQQSLAVATAAYLAELDRVSLADLMEGVDPPRADTPSWLTANAWRWQASALGEGA